MLDLHAPSPGAMKIPRRGLVHENYWFICRHWRPGIRAGGLSGRLVSRGTILRRGFRGKKEEKKEEKAPVKARFPKDLAPAARAEAVSRAAAFNANAKFHRMAILKTNGVLYQDWQDKLKEEWQAESVEETSLVIVVGPQKKKFVEIIHYPGGAPPINRYNFELEASVVEAKTGKVLANRLFINKARDIIRIETWDTTALGSPVEFRTVFQWAASEAARLSPH